MDAFEASAPLAFGFIDTDFRLMRFNDTLARLNGLSAGTGSGPYGAEAVPELWPVFEPHYRTVVDNGDEVSVVHSIQQ